MTVLGLGRSEARTLAVAREKGGRVPDRQASSERERRGKGGGQRTNAKSNGEAQNEIRTEDFMMKEESEPERVSFKEREREEGEERKGGRRKERKLTLNQLRELSRLLDRELYETSPRKREKVSVPKGIHSTFSLLLSPYKEARGRKR